MAVVYLGFNDPRFYARGVEYVIKAQSAAASRSYYLFWGERREVFRWGRIICVSVKKDWVWPIRLNFLVNELDKRHRSLIIHGHNYLMSVVLVKRIDIFTVHDGLSYLKRSIGKTCFIWPLLERLVYRKVDILHFVSEYSRAMALDVANRASSLVIHNVCARELIEYSKTTPAPQHDRPYLLAVRSIEDRAGIDLLIGAALILNESAQFTHKIVVAGKGPLLEAYKKKVAERCPDIIEFRGYVSDSELSELYMNCSFTITPALYGEGFGLPVIESYFYGKEAIASDVCALPEIIRSKKFLFENTGASLAALVKVVLNSRSDPGECKLYYNARFSLKLYLGKFGRIYEQLKASKLDEI